ncbi:hypothetical protein NERG_00497 [Nematocida ausubeli]|uniref:Uncharacterized protein n=1 Tax=Nematocida ausubeli (strain ATCC PRA-371 / ERTm2) TaxID=1913371 RepID=H8ZA76_NEMA1|nr:hypothetical protein NERG_00497 [Nematocida ausubeli]
MLNILTRKQHSDLRYTIMSRGLRIALKELFDAIKVLLWIPSYYTNHPDSTHAWSTYDQTELHADNFHQEMQEEYNEEKNNTDAQSTEFTEESENYDNTQSSHLQNIEHESYENPLPVIQTTNSKNILKRALKFTLKLLQLTTYLYIVLFFLKCIYIAFKFPFVYCATFGMYMDDDGILLSIFMNESIISGFLRFIYFTMLPLVIIYRTMKREYPSFKKYTVCIIIAILSIIISNTISYLIYRKVINSVYMFIQSKNNILFDLALSAIVTLIYVSTAFSELYSAWVASKIDHVWDAVEFGQKIYLIYITASFLYVAVSIVIVLSTLFKHSIIDVIAHILMTITTLFRI